MTARRTAVAVAALGFVPLALAAPAAAHGSMTDPVSRVAACYAEGPEAPKSAACKALVRVGGTQPLYDWNEVNIANAAGNHKRLIPDGRLCSAGNAKYRGLDLPRRDWPASRLSAGKHTFRYKATAPHRGTFALYVTKDGYDPSKPLKWSDLESKPFLKVTDPRLSGGDYVFKGTVPKKSGRHLVYSIWQRSDSPEAFYTCSDVVFRKSGGSGAQTPAGSAPAAGPTAQAPDEDRIRKDAGRSSHGGHGTTGGHGSGSGPDSGSDAGSGTAARAAAAEGTAATTGGGDPVAQGGAVPLGGDADLAETGSGSATPVIAVAGAGTLAVGAAVLFATVRRRAVAGRHGR
ncbi:lytic polysaccharide monooxygenase [Streptomyces bambusae]|uniref:lytic polysaccharide monooxygenase n=1 Tax=Streptomyces bambusae TaxID=1550616 RepID=UPI001CFDFF96|nr:lytic polysaccharide monooxygenase [Streptomyces bambusae]MCB5167113.1 lytic polysaccharide monooxygenase [Streptomyces bambusae]